LKNTDLKALNLNCKQSSVFLKISPFDKIAV